jgi:hypothetical protein
MDSADVKGWWKGPLWRDEIGCASIRGLAALSEDHNVDKSR